MRAFPPFRLDTVNQCLWHGEGLAATEAPDIRIARGQCIEGYGSKEAY